MLYFMMVNRAVCVSRAARGVFRNSTCKVASSATATQQSVAASHPGPRGCTAPARRRNLRGCAESANAKLVKRRAPVPRAPRVAPELNS